MVEAPPVLLLLLLAIPGEGAKKPVPWNKEELVPYKSGRFQLNGNICG
jgi:hypothetical protein